MFKRTCFYKEPRFKSQHPHVGSKPSVTLVSEYLMPFSDPTGHQAHGCCIGTHGGKTCTHKINLKRKPVSNRKYIPSKTPMW